VALQDFEKLRERLLDTSQWPLQYMFKFIVPNRNGLVDKVTDLLPKNGKLSFKHTENLKYVSVTCVAIMFSADEIISVTNKATNIQGVIAL